MEAVTFRKYVSTVEEAKTALRELYDILNEIELKGLKPIPVPIVRFVTRHRMIQARLATEDKVYYIYVIFRGEASRIFYKIQDKAYEMGFLKAPLMEKPSVLKRAVAEILKEIGG